MFIHKIQQFLRFYWGAVTKYQLHSPVVFDLAQALVQDQRWYYAFSDIEAIRQQMLKSAVVLHFTDFGAGQASGSVPLRRVARRSASSGQQGQRLFRLANWVQPKSLLELGTSVGVGTMYLASGAKNGRFITLEGAADCAAVAKSNLELLGLTHVEVRSGEFGTTLASALADLAPVDLIYLDGNHRRAATLDYFEQCLAAASDKAVFIFDDVYWSAEMTVAWTEIQNHPRVTTTVDFFDLSLAFINPDFRERQHYRIVPYWWKPWKFF
ncbi:MAG: class I SAM-dependent methyltransferase [Saprospiraceae bacterium]|nr:class I SAM-dependent methyltransferase [Saprospiraceae bacterium]